MKMRTVRGIAAAAAITLLLVGCGDDDEAEDARAGAEDGSAELVAFCDGYFELNSGEPTPEKIRALAATAPEEAKGPMESIASGFEEEGDEYTDSEEFGSQYQEVSQVVADECADDSITVTASEYKFEGIPSNISAGVVAADFENAGDEMHEIVLLRKKAGVEEGFDDILAKGEEEAQDLVDIWFGAFGPPGSASTAVFDMSEPGAYAAVCFIPVGSTPETEEADGPPHFTRGMKVEFRVE